MAKWSPDSGRDRAAVGELEAYWERAYCASRSSLVFPIVEALVEVGELVYAAFPHSVRPRVGANWAEVDGVVRASATAARVASEGPVCSLDVAHAVLAYPGRRSAP